MRAVRPKPSPAACGWFSRRRLRGLPVLVHEVSRRALGSTTTQDRAETRAIAPAHVAFRHFKSVGVLIASFRSSIPSPPIPLFTLRCAPRGAQRKTRGRVVRYSFLVRTLSFPASCRFIPAHRNTDFSPGEMVVRRMVGSDNSVWPTMRQESRSRSCPVLASYRPRFPNALCRSGNVPLVWRLRLFLSEFTRARRAAIMEYTAGLKASPMCVPETEKSLSGRSVLQ